MTLSEMWKLRNLIFDIPVYWCCRRHKSRYKAGESIGFVRFQDLERPFLWGDNLLIKPSSGSIKFNEVPLRGVIAESDGISHG